MGIERVESSDAELVRRIRTGDIGAYGALVSRYRDRLARCDDPARFGAWLYGILVNRCRTSGARAARRRRMFVRDADALHGAARADQSDRLEWTDAVDRALARLAPESREAFLLKHVEDLEYEEIAELTGAGVSALKMRVKRAREQLQRYLREAEHV